METKRKMEPTSIKILSTINVRAQIKNIRLEERVKNKFYNWL